MVGCGVYGYKDNVEEVLKKLGRKVKEGECWMDGSSSNGTHMLTCFHDDGRNEEIVYHDERKDGPYSYADAWIGVSKKSMRFLRDMFNDWCTDNGIEKDSPLRNILKGTKLRFNQGDAFFANKLGTEVPATSPGSPDAPVLHRLLK
jgi:hypothetical protein